MSQTLLFPNPDGLAWLLWGEPGADPKKAAAYPVIIAAREAWASGNPDRIQKAMKALGDFIARIMFQPLPDVGNGPEAELLVLGYQLPPETGRKPSGITFVATTVAPGPANQIVPNLRKAIDDRHHAPGFFDQCILRVHQIAPINLLQPAAPLSFGAPPQAPLPPASDLGDVV